MVAVTRAMHSSLLLCCSLLIQKWELKLLLCATAQVGAVCVFSCLCKYSNTVSVKAANLWEMGPSCAGEGGGGGILRAVPSMCVCAAFGEVCVFTRRYMCVFTRRFVHASEAVSCERFCMFMQRYMYVCMYVCIRREILVLMKRYVYTCVYEEVVNVDMRAYPAISGVLASIMDGQCHQLSLKPTEALLGPPCHPQRGTLPNAAASISLRGAAHEGQWPLVTIEP